MIPSFHHPITVSQASPPPSELPCTSAPLPSLEQTLEPEFNFDAFAYRPTQDQPNPGSQDVIDLTRSTCSGPAKTAMVEQKRDVPWETPLTAPWSETNAGDARGEIEADELGLSMRTGRKARTWDDVSKQDRSRVGTNRDSRLWSSGGRRGSSSWHQGEKESVLGDQLGTSDDDRNHYRNPDRGGDSFAYVTSDRDVMAMDPSIGSWTTTRRRGSFFDPSDSYRSTVGKDRSIREATTVCFYPPRLSTRRNACFGLRVALLHCARYTECAVDIWALHLALFDLTSPRPLSLCPESKSSD